MNGAPAQKFKVADISLAAFGRREIELAEVEMPGLMAIRRSTRPISLWLAHALLDVYT